MVEHRPSANRFVLAVPDGEAKLAYRMVSPTVMDLASTFVPSTARGRGAGAQLVEAALKHARANGLHVLASCWYAVQFMDKHPEYNDLLEPQPGSASGASCEI